MPEASQFVNIFLLALLSSSLYHLFMALKKKTNLEARIGRRLVSFTVPPGEFAQLRKAAEQEKRKVTDLARMIVREWMERRSS